MIKSKQLKGLVIRTAITVGRQMGFIFACEPAREAREEAHTIILTYNKGEIDRTEANFDIVSACLFENPEEGSVCISEAGYYDISTDDNQVTDDIFSRSFPKSTNRRSRGIRSVHEIDGIAYAVGFRGMVYRLDQLNTWTRIDEGLPESFDCQAIHGLSSSNLYAVGLNGGVYFFDGNIWTQQDIPTNNHLTCVVHTPIGNVYIGGHNGTMLVGKNGQWEILDIDDFNKDIWDVEWFDNQLFVSTLNGLFTLKNSSLTPINTEENGSFSTYQLSKYGDVLWSNGEYDIMEYDGNSWSRIL